MNELVVKPSEQVHDPVFDGKCLGLGLFLPERTHRAMTAKVITEPLTFDGAGVSRIKLTDMADWQRDYSITDIDDKKYVFVPSDKNITCVLFRTQHSRKANHSLVQSRGEACGMVHIMPMHPGEFDAFTHPLTLTLTLTRSPQP